MFLENKYTNCYYRLIVRGQTRTLPKETYIEKHHIIPISMGGSNELSNLVKLTAREHFIVHLLLTKMTEGKDKRNMSYAFSLFNTNCKNHFRNQMTSFWYEYMRKQLSFAHSNRVVTQKTRDALSRIHRGKIISDEQKLNISIALSKKVAFYALSPSKIEFQGDDLRLFCKEQNVSYNTIKNFTNYFIITAGKNKEWFFSKEKKQISDINLLIKQTLKSAADNRTKAIKNQWTDKRKIEVGNKLKKEIILQDPSNNIITFGSLGDIKTIGPVSTIQQAQLNYIITRGPWSGWKRIK